VVCALSSDGGVDEAPGGGENPAGLGHWRLGCMGFLGWRCVQVGTVQWVMVANGSRVVVLRWNCRDSVQSIEDSVAKVYLVLVRSTRLSSDTVLATVGCRLK
jgi:hypothetical protein